MPDGAATAGVGAREGLPPGGGPLSPGVRLTAGRGGLPRLEVATALANAEVYLQGAHVTAYAPRGSAPVLFLNQTRATCVVRDPVGRRRVEMVKTGSEATVV